VYPALKSLENSGATIPIMQGASAQVMRLTHTKLIPFLIAIHSLKVAKDSVL
jgi:hypothetical protein